MEAYGYSDWEGNDRHFMGWAGTGVALRPRDRRLGGGVAASQRDVVSAEPWFLTVALVNPHDVMWFPIDQPEWRPIAPRRARDGARRCSRRRGGRTTRRCRRTSATIPTVVETLPENFHDDLHTKPDAHRAWRWSQQHGIWGYIDPSDKEAWLPPPRLLRRVAPAGRRVARRRAVARSRRPARGTTPRSSSRPTTATCAARTGCGRRARSSTTRSCACRCYVRVPGVTAPGSTIDGAVEPRRPRHDDLRARRASSRTRRCRASTSFGDARARDHVLFAHDSAHTKLVQQTRYAIRGMFDGRYKYARYYGVGGGKPSDDPFYKRPTTKQYDVDADFDDQDHELYDLQEDPARAREPRQRPRPPQRRPRPLRAPQVPRSHPLLRRMLVRRGRCSDHGDPEFGGLTGTSA